MDRASGFSYGLPIFDHLANMGDMQTTVDIHDAILARAKCHPMRTGRTLRAVFEEGLRKVLSEDPPRHRYRLPDWSAGEAREQAPLESYPWQDLREMISGRREIS